MASVAPGMAFEGLLQALHEQYGKDVAYSRKQGALDTGQMPSQTASKRSAENGVQATTPDMTDLSPRSEYRSVRHEDARGGMTQVVPLQVVPLHVLASEQDLDIQSVASEISAGQAGTGGAKKLKSGRTFVKRRPQEQLGVAKSPSALTEQSQDQLTPLQKFVNSNSFDKLSSALLVSNALFIGIQVEHMFDPDSAPVWIEVVDVIYGVCFVLELGARLLGSGCRNFWCDPDNMWWNIFDFVVVFLSTADTVIGLALKGQNSPLTSISVLRIVRIVRIVRVLRIIRVLKFFQDLRVLIASIVSTLKTATFAFALIFMIMFMYGIGITQLVAQYVATKRIEGEPVDKADSQWYDADMMFFFGSVPKTIFALFMTISGGIDWKDAAVPLQTVGPLSLFFYMSFVVLMILCVMNVLTGIFCQSAIETAQNDRDNVMQTQLREKKDYIRTLEGLFCKWDASRDGKCTKQEFESHLHDRETEALLRTLEIEARDSLALFDLLDADGTGEVDLDEFVTGCISLRGYAKAVHLEKVAAMVSTHLNTSLDAINKKVQLILEQSAPHQNK